MFILAAGATFIVLAGSVKAEFTQVASKKASIGSGDWTGPELRIVSLPEESIADYELNLVVQAEDTFSNIAGFEYALYSGDFGEETSDWITAYTKIKCQDEDCGSRLEKGELRLFLDRIQNPNHRLCSQDRQWCPNMPLPDGRYYVLVRAYDESNTLRSEGNSSKDLIYRFEKKSELVICMPDLPIRARAGEPLQFPSIACEGEPGLASIAWDVDERDGFEFNPPDMAGDSPLFSEGFKIPGTYTGHVRAVSGKGQSKIAQFLINIENPVLAFGNLAINEYMPDPSGDDIAPMPEGEWIEIYNDLDQAVDMTGFVLYDAMDNHSLPITSDNSEGGDTIVRPHAYKTVYRNGNVRFSLNNSGPERVRLADGFISSGGILLDESQYLDSIPEGQSLKRVPDHVGSFIVGAPSKGMANLP